ncbi:MAG: OsmC family protein [Flavobacteriaceae bacterium]|nr:OsmC family protein [Flavobacteriaceae bacterium]
MKTTSKIIYQGGLRTASTHLRSGSVIHSDAPIDNNGLGQAFSPTDCVANALGSCMITVMAIKANQMGIELKDSRLEVKKHMASDPRRISCIEVDLYLPELSEKDAKILERVGNTCPVLESLHPDLDKQIRFHWNSL